MNIELYSRIQVAEIGDRISVVNSEGKLLKVCRIKEITPDFIKTPEYTFLKKTGECNNKFDDLYKIDDIYFDTFVRVNKFFKYRKFILVKEHFNYNYYSKASNSDILDITIYKKSNNNKDSIHLIISCNDIILFTGDIKNVFECETIYNCTIKKFENGKN